ncbi:portal protein [Massilia sp. TN1-12]|uniref:portal protein n=1 Tax=Massilia paldalensis TaxID=3377675 RepID=UPI00385130DA
MADTKDKDLHAEGLRIYDIAIERDNENRERYSDDVRFARLSEQWPEKVRQQREKDGRPCLTINKLPAFIRQVVNDARQNTPQIKFHAVGEGSDQWTAKVLDGLVRNIEVTSNADVAYDTAIENAVTGGVGYWRITTDYTSDDAFDQDIRIEPIPNSLSVVPDAYDMGADSANWNDAFVTETYSLDAFKAKWPKADTASFEGDRRGECHPDWLEGDDIMVAEWWKRREVEKTLIKLSDGTVMFEEQLADPVLQDVLKVQGITEVARRPVRSMQVTQHIMNGVEIIETNEWAGKYIPIVPVYGDQVIIDGKRHLKSMIHDAKDAQRSFNFWRTTTTEVASRAPQSPWVGPVGAFASDTNWATSNTVAHPYLEYDGDVPPQRIFAGGPDAASMQEAMNASDDMKSVMGLYDASLGAQSNETSGRAILARQREGDVSTFNFTDNQNRGIRHTGRILADLIPKTYTVERIIRVIHEDGTNENVKINAPTQPIQAQQQAAQGQQQPATHEQIGIEHVYDLTSGKYDVTCESGPSYTTQREEAAQQMMNFMQAYPAAAPVIGDLFAKNLDWPGAEEIAERLKAMLPPQIQGQNPQLMQAQQVIQQLQQAMGQLQQQLQEAERDKSQDNRKLDIDAFKAVTERIDKLGLTITPEAAAALGFQLLQPTMQAIDGPDITPGGQQQIPAPAPQEQPQPAMPQPMPGPAQPPEGIA